MAIMLIGNHACIGVGVGNATATPTNALLLHILQDTVSRTATILFAHRIGTAIEPECKRYRFAADIFNDVGMVLNCLSPVVAAGGVRVGVLCAAGVLQAICGVAGGSSKASLSAHFAKNGNLGEVNAVRWFLVVLQAQLEIEKVPDHDTNESSYTDWTFWSRKIRLRRL